MPAGEPKGELGRWLVRRVRGPASALHGRDWPGPGAVVAAATVLEVDGPALVLGSTQAAGVVDGARAAQCGVEVVRRRSGGGAVLLEPGSVLWIDVEVPAGDPLWSDDVGRAFWWLGDVWAEALALAGVEGEVWRGPSRPGEWGGLVCFAGVGPGEVTVGGAKVVGLCQRRTRAGALFQCGALLGWEPEALAGLLGVDGAAEAAAGWRAAAAGLGGPELEAAFLRALAAY